MARASSACRRQAGRRSRLFRFKRRLAARRGRQRKIECRLRRTRATRQKGIGRMRIEVQYPTRGVPRRIEIHGLGATPEDSEEMIAAAGRSEVAAGTESTEQPRNARNAELGKKDCLTAEHAEHTEHGEGFLWLRSSGHRQRTRLSSRTSPCIPACCARDGRGPVRSGAFRAIGWRGNSCRTGSRRRCL